MKSFSVQDVVQMVSEQGGDENAAQQIMTILQDPDMEKDAMGLLMAAFAGVKEKVLKKALKEFRATGSINSLRQLFTKTVQGSLLTVL